MPTCNIAVSAHAAALSAWHAYQALLCLVGIWYCTLPSPHALASMQSLGNALLSHSTHACEQVYMGMLPNPMSYCVRM
jgi:hypothetical protein